MKDGSFTMDVKSIRDRARQQMEDGAMTSGYKAKADVVLRLLNEALATELVCVLPIDGTILWRRESIQTA